MAVTVHASIGAPGRTFEAPRLARTKPPTLLAILVLTLCTLLTGEEGVQDRALFGKSTRTQPCGLAWTQAVAR
jgi:hypothetical protein